MDFIPLGSSYYIFTACCDGSKVFFTTSVGTSIPNGVSIYNGTSYNGGNPIPGTGGMLMPGKCYDVLAVVSLTTVYNYPPFTAAMAADLSSAGGSCFNEVCDTCPKKVILHPCCGTGSISFAYDPDYPVSNTNSFQYIGPNLIFGDGGVLIPNSCFTLEIVNTTEEEANSLPSGPPAQTISLVGKSCDIFDPGVVCAPCEYYYQITNCVDPGEVYCTTSNLSGYINNEVEDPSLWRVIQVEQFPNKCFYVEQVVSCVAPIQITPVSSLPFFAGCTECQNALTVYYELINCNNPSIVVYTSTDLNEYVNSYITLEEYGDQCFYVSVVSGLTPGDVTVTPTGDTFVTCEDCSLPRYLLEDCLGVAEPIITQTNLSAYVDKVITLETCPDICWYVSETNDTTSSAPVYINESFVDCPACFLATKTCLCATVTNNTEIPQSTSYVDCANGSLSRGYMIQPGATSDKICVLAFANQNLTIVEYGNCIDGVCPTDVIIPPKPQRKVTPGYDTPACTAEYYEKVECAFSEWMYKDVLEKRYGISNCCPDELIKWEIKHEMLILNALINPNYICVPPVNCGCAQPTTCNCSCNSGN